MEQFQPHKPMHQIQSVPVDTEGNHLACPREHDTKAEAIAWLKEARRDRAYWRQLAESDTFPDEIDRFVVLVNGIEREEFYPIF